MDENNRLCQDVPETACNNSADDASTSPAVVPLNVEHKENNLPNSALTDAFDVKRNDKCDMKAEQARRRRRLSSGFIPSPKMSGDINPNFITHNIRTSVASEETPKGCKEKRKINEGLQNSDYSEVTSRTGACDHALKVLYSLKTKLSSLLHSDCSVKKNNEILRAKKQSMTDGIVVLEECIKQIQHLVMKDEEIVVEAVLRSSRTLSCLTESCEVLYNAQYSMRHFALELVDAIDKLIDVLITTDAWSSTNSSELTVELHKDKCELVGSSLESLRKIINAL